MLVALACLPAALVAGRLFAGMRYLAPLAGAVVAAALVAWLSAQLVARLELVWLLGLVGGVLYGVVLTAGNVDLLVSGLRVGWPRVLAAAVPAEPRAVLLIPLGAMLWVAAHLAVVLVVRTENTLLPLLPPLVGLIGVLLLVGDAGDGVTAATLALGGWRPSPVLLTGAFILLAMAVAALRAARPLAAPDPATGPAGGPDGPGGPAGPGGPDGSPGRARRALNGSLVVTVVVVVVVTLLATVIGRQLPVAARFDPREHVSPPVENVTALNPLVQVRAQLVDAEHEVFTVRLADDPRTGRPAVADTRVRIAALGDFDGASWRDDGRFVRVDQTLPTSDGSSVRPSTSVTVRAEVTFGAAGSDLLPTFGQPTSVTYHPAAEVAGAAPVGGSGDAPDLVFQPSSGSLAALATPARGDRVELVMQVPRPSQRALAEAVPATGTAAEPYTTLPGRPSWLEATAKRLVGDARTPYQQLDALQKALAGPGYPYDLSASPGHSYGVLNDFLNPQQETDSHGYAEQHATAFAALARALGFPTRVAVGYLLDRNRVTTDGAFTVTNWQAHAWPEVLLAGIGWVSFEPTDISDLRHRAPTVEPMPLGGRSIEAPASLKPLEPPGVDPPSDAGGGAGGGAGRVLAWTLLIAVVSLLGLVLVTLSLIIGEKARRRAARSRGTAGDRVRGAWHEARDRLAEHGVSRSRALTYREVLGLAGQRPATAAAEQPLRELAALAEMARFAGGGAFEPDATRAWQLVAQIRQGLRNSNGRASALRARIDPRPLLPPPRGSSDLPPDPAAEVAPGGQAARIPEPAVSAGPATGFGPPPAPGPVAGFGSVDGVGPVAAPAAPADPQPSEPDGPAGPPPSSWAEPR
ncbi:Transglutaminase-like superfamily protein [Parafrankia irregularis]|uniref:Transglutaminase-like superfamily protein n=1 Tax=Parafrankia irregularis TaxID=795642 RepID=A0A0S4QGP2_9ACTN|nr:MULTISPECIES: transglutaminase domain-containing protein [Parafrankia]MBE3199453.1 transglutaminase domain-containing protein [Parafrankia sp. CH37]CUU53884.1 Transglutaminase-like superfamily protein [Parafrankia irregularis]